MSDQLTGDWGKFGKALRNLSSLDMADVHKRISRRILTNTRRRFRAGVDPEGVPWRKPKWRQGQTLRDTGTLRKSIHAKSSSAFAAVGTNIEYARIHQFGGVIRPKDTKFLAIPWSEEARGYGYARVFPKGRLRFKPGSRGPGGLVEDVGTRRKKTILHYLLRTQVTMPNRPFLGVSFDDRRDIKEVIGGFFKRAVRV